MGALFRVQLVQVLSFEEEGAVGDLVLLAAGQDLGERALAGPVGAHDGVHFTGLDVQVQSLEDLDVLGLDVQVLDVEHGWISSVC